MFFFTTTVTEFIKQNKYLAYLVKYSVHIYRQVTNVVLNIHVFKRSKIEYLLELAHLQLAYVPLFSSSRIM